MLGAGLPTAAAAESGGTGGARLSGRRIPAVWHIFSQFGETIVSPRCAASSKHAAAPRL